MGDMCHHHHSMLSQLLIPSLYTSLKGQYRWLPSYKATLVFFHWFFHRESFSKFDKQHKDVPCIDGSNSTFGSFLSSLEWGLEGLGCLMTPSTNMVLRMTCNSLLLHDSGMCASLLRSFPFSFMDCSQACHQWIMIDEFPSVQFPKTFW